MTQGGSLIKPMDIIFDQPIGVCYPFPQMLGLEPGFDEERFEIEALLGDILKNAPGISAVASPLLPDLLDRGEEFRGIVAVDAVANRHEDGAILVLDLPRQHRRAPMHRRGQVDPSAD